MLDIYSIGDLHFLATILNSVAAWAGTSNPAHLAATGGIIGVLALCVQSIINGGKAPQFQNLLIGLIFYWFLMGPGVGVTIHDVYSGQTQNVGNVPLGVAVVGSVMSSVSFSITHNMEQMFSTPGMTACYTGGGPAAECGYLGGVTQMSIPSIDLYMPGLLGLPAAQQGNIRKTLINYVKDCTYTGLTLDANLIENIMKNPDPLAAIGFASDVYGTQTYIPSVDPVMGTSRTCTDAYNQISSYLSGTGFWDNIKAHIKATVGTTGDPYVEGQNYLDIMTTQTAQPAENIYSVYMAKILGNIVQEGISSEELMKYNMSTGNITEAQAINQRNDQWEGDHRLFQTTIRPAMTFFEGLFYAITPFMAFIIMIVPFGIKIIIKYLQTAVWIQCWMPLMSIVNLFAYMAYYKQFTALNSESTSVSSLYGIVANSSSAADWVAQANLLGSMVPALSMIIVYGSSITLTHMASQLKGGDYWDETHRNPNVIKNEPVYTNSLLGGQRGAGANAIAPKIDVADDYQQMQTSSMADIKAAQATYNKQIGQTLQQGYSSNLSYNESTGLIHQLAASGSQSSQFVEKLASTMDSKLANTAATQSKLMASLAAGIGWDSIAGAKGNLQDIYGSENSEKFDTAIADAQSIAGSTDITAALKDSISHDHKNGTASVLSATVGESVDEKLQKTASDIKTKQDEYRSLMADSERNSMRIGGDIVSLGQQVIDKKYAPALAKATKDAHIRESSQSFRDKYDYYRSPFGYGMGDQQALAAARLMSLDEQGRNGNIDASNRLVSILKGMNFLNDQPGEFSDPATNMGLSGNAEKQANEAMEGANDLKGPSQTVDTDLIDNQVHNDPTKAPVINAFNGKGGYNDQVSAANKAGQKESNAQQAEVIQGNMLQNLADRSAAEQGLDFAGDRFSSLVNGAGSALKKLGDQLEGNAEMRYVDDPVQFEKDVMALRPNTSYISQARAVGINTPEGEAIIKNGIASEKKAGQLWQELKDKGLTGLISDRYQWAVNEVDNYYNHMTSLTQDTYSNLVDTTSGMLATDPSAARQAAINKATAFGLVGEQRELYADMSILSQRPGNQFGASNARDLNYNLDELPNHTWQRDAQGNRTMPDAISRTIINAALTNVGSNLNQVKAYNELVR